jgi:hypothetical protein
MGTKSMFDQIRIQGDFPRPLLLIYQKVRGYDRVRGEKLPEREPISGGGDVSSAASSSIAMDKATFGFHMEVIDECVGWAPV